MIKGVIFDLDGTLIDTIDDIGNSTNLMLEELGFKTYGRKDYKLMVGNGFRNLVISALPDGSSEELVDKAYDRFVYYYDLHYKDTSCPYDGIISLLKELNAKGVMIAVNSNKRDDYTKALIKQLFGDVNFIEVVGQREGVPSKPSPDGAKIILDAMNLNNEEVVFVGDTKVDIATGKNAGLKTIGVLWGFRDRQELETAGADDIVATPKEILAIVDRE